MATTKPGDTIEISVPPGHPGFKLNGEKYTVIPCPSDRVDGPNGSEVWVRRSDGEAVVVPSGTYVVAKTAETKNVDDFLRRQLNANLASIFS